MPIAAAQYDYVVVGAGPAGCLLANRLSANPAHRVLLFDEPTRGIDVGAKFDIYALMGALAREGRALVVVSSDLRELMLICDRIGVMSAGRMTGIFARGAWSQDALLGAAFAGYRAEDAMLADAADLPAAGDVHTDAGGSAS